MITYWGRTGQVTDGISRREPYELAEACQPVTIAQLIALRNSGGLKTECHYVITDYNRANVGAAEIFLHAVNENSLSIDCHIKTSFDNLAWSGTYDIDTNRITSLKDNIGNNVFGQNSVDSFPWGVPSVSENEVRYGILDYTSGSVTENYIGSSARLDADGATIAQNRFEQSSNTRVVSGTFQDNIVSGDANVTILSGLNIENKFGTSTTYNQVGSGYIRYSKIDGNSSIINGNTNINNSTFESATTFNSTNSTGNVANSTFCYGRINVQNIPDLTLSQITIYSAEVSGNNAARLDLYRSAATSSGRFLVSSGAQLDCSYSEARNFGYIQCTAGSLVANYSEVSSYSYISHQSTGTNRVDRCQVSSNSNIRFLNTCTGGRIYYCSVRSNSSLYQNGTSQNCYHYYNDVNSNAQMYIQNGVNARHYYNNCNSFSYIRQYGTGSGQSFIYYCNASARGYIEHLNIDALIRFYSVSSSSQSIVRQTGGTVNANLYYSSFSAYYYALLSLTGGTRSGLHGYGRQNFNGMPASNGSGARNWT